MLTYRDYVYSVLNEYATDQMAVVTIPEQIETERQRRESLRAAKTDGDRVSGGDGQRTMRGSPRYKGRPTLPPSSTSAAGSSRPSARSSGRWMTMRGRS